MAYKDRITMRASRVSGFSLIEVMVVVVIIGIIASIALPSYREHVVKTRRAAGAACLMQAAQQMERFYTTALAYNAAGSPAAFVCDSDVSAHYRVEPAAAATAKAYTLQAVPLGAQAAQDTTCGTLAINQLGTRTPTTAGCW